MRISLVKSVLLPLFALILISCTTPSTTTPVVVTPTNTSPSTLIVMNKITEDQNDLYPVLQVDMHFSSNQIANINTVDFMNESKIICNGADLKFNGSDYTANAPTDTNGAYTCTYFWSGGTTAFPQYQQIQLFPRIAPQGKLITVGYNSNGGCQVKLEATDGTHNVTITPKGDSGIIGGINVSSLSGPGTLKLTRTCISRLFGVGFNEIDGTYIAMSTLNVTWNA